MQRDEYKDRVIEVRVFRLESGFGWEYQIDGGAPRRSEDRPIDDEEATRKQAFIRAKAEIDLMDAV